MLICSEQSEQSPRRSLAPDHLPCSQLSQNSLGFYGESPRGAKTLAPIEQALAGQQESGETTADANPTPPNADNTEVEVPGGLHSAEAEIALRQGALLPLLWHGIQQPSALLARDELGAGLAAELLESARHSEGGTGGEGKRPLFASSARERQLHGLDFDRLLARRPEIRGKLAELREAVALRWAPPAERQQQQQGQQDKGRQQQGHLEKGRQEPQHKQEPQQGSQQGQQQQGEEEEDLTRGVRGQKKQEQETMSQVVLQVQQQMMQQIQPQIQQDKLPQGEQQAGVPLLQLMQQMHLQQATLQHEKLQQLQQGGQQEGPQLQENTADLPMLLQQLGVFQEQHSGAAPQVIEIQLPSGQQQGQPQQRLVQMLSQGSAPAQQVTPCFCPSHAPTTSTCLSGGLCLRPCNWCSCQTGRFSL